MATTMIGTCRAMPTAVITESREKTISRTRSWINTDRNTCRPPTRRLGGVLGLELVVDLPRGLPDQEEAPAQEDEIASGEGVPADREEGAGQPHQPGNREEEPDADQEGQPDSEPPGQRLLGAGQAGGEDGDEDDVVDAEDDLHRRQRRESDQGVPGEEGVHGQRDATRSGLTRATPGRFG